MSDVKLSEWQAEYPTNSPQSIFAEKEWLRRERIEQHKLDLELLSKQVKWMKFSAILGVIATLVGAIIGSNL